MSADADRDRLAKGVQRAVVHANADRKCGRDWVCNCGSCRIARAAGYPADRIAQLTAELAEAWRALGTTAEEAADDPDTAALADSIRVSLQYERDQIAQAREQLAVERTAHAVTTAKLGQAVVALRAARFSPAMIDGASDGLVQQIDIVLANADNKVAGEAHEEVEVLISAVRRFIKRTADIDENHPAYGFVVMGIPLAKALAPIDARRGSSK